MLPLTNSLFDKIGIYHALFVEKDFPNVLIAFEQIYLDPNQDPYPDP